jgi:lipoprotein-anchoring transpeptidase ErfK/SrfK
MRRAVLAVALVAAAVAAAAVAGRAEAALDGPRIPQAVAETTYLVARANKDGAWLALRARPGGPVLAKVRSQTQFGGRPALAVVREEGGWLGVAAPELPNGRLGWVRRETVRISLTRVSLVADLSERTLTLQVGGRAVRTIRVAIGAGNTSTPTGRFAVTDKFPGSIYGSYLGCCVLALSGHQPNLPPGWDGGDLLGIHGTYADWTIGLPISAGCLRASDDDMRVLMRRVPIGAPVFIRA